MKTLPLICVGLIISFMASAQFINSMSISPLQPTIQDTIFIYTTVSFGAGSCDDHTQSTNIIGDQIYAEATHCTGMLTVICTTTDTFKINPLPLGNYTFHFNVNQGAYPAPCTLGILPGESDSLFFTVSPLAEISEHFKFKSFLVFPNPANDYLTLSIKNISPNKMTKVSIISMTGSEVFTIKATSEKSVLDLKNIPAGVYLISIINDKINEKQLLTLIK